jgi:hypothetical protein
MKKFVLIACLFVCACLHAQPGIPKFTTNATKKDSIGIAGFLKATSDYDLVIALKSVCYWFSTDHYYAIGSKAGKWNKFIYYDRFRVGDSITDSSKVIIKKHHAKQKRCDTTWQSLLSQGLLLLHNDSLNVAEKKVYDSASKDTMYETESISDGITYEFIIKTKGVLRVIYCSNPDEYRKWLPHIQDTRRFIQCLNIYHGLWTFKRSLFYRIKQSIPRRRHGRGK